MKVYQFVPLAALVIGAFCGFAYKIGAPMEPLVLIGAFGTFLAVLQLEDHKWGNYLRDIIAGLREAMKH
jgi:hypothetical protein